MAELHRDLQLRQESYRGQALKIFPHICARCGREFTGKRLRELTVHHKDINHDNNPPDGSNWELLCIYCHEEEHAPDSLRAMGDDGQTRGGRVEKSPISNPFEKLGAILNIEGEVPGPKTEKGP